MQQFYIFKRSFDGTWQKLQFSCKTLKFIVIDACRMPIHSCQHGISSRSINGGKMYSNIYVILEMTMMKLAKEGVSSAVASRIFRLWNILAQKNSLLFEKVSRISPLRDTFIEITLAKCVRKVLFFLPFPSNYLSKLFPTSLPWNSPLSSKNSLYFRKKNSNANFRLAAEAKLKSLGYTGNLMFVNKIWDFLVSLASSFMVQTRTRQTWYKIKGRGAFDTNHPEAATTSQVENHWAMCSWRGNFPWFITSYFLTFIFTRRYFSEYFKVKSYFEIKDLFFNNFFWYFQLTEFFFWAFLSRDSKVWKNKNSNSLNFFKKASEILKMNLK